MSSAPEINGTVLNFVFGPSSVCCCITTERSERNAVVQISAQMKFGHEGRRFLRQPDLEFDRVGRPVELEEAGRADELCAAGAAGQLDRPGAGRRLVVRRRERAARRRGRESASFSLPALNPASVPLRKVGPFGMAPGQQNWFVTCSSAPRRTRSRSMTGAAEGRRRASSSRSSAANAPVAIRIAARDMLRRLGTGGPCVSTAGVPIRSPWTVGLVQSVTGAPSRSATRSTAGAEPPEVGGPAHVELARRLLLRGGGLDVAADQHLGASVPPPASRRTPRRPPGRSGRARPRPAPPGCRRPGARSLAASRGGEV